MSLLQMAGGVAVAGVVAAGTTAFTAAGVTGTTTSSFAGGTVSQSVYGATVSTVAYTFADAPTNTQLTGVTIVFADAHSDNATVAVAPVGGSWASGGSFTCTTPTSLNSHTSVCTDGGGDHYNIPLTSISITVS